MTPKTEPRSLELQKRILFMVQLFRDFSQEIPKQFQAYITFKQEDPKDPLPYQATEHAQCKECSLAERGDGALMESS